MPDPNPGSYSRSPSPCYPTGPIDARRVAWRKPKRRASPRSRACPESKDGIRELVECVVFVVVLVSAL